MKHAIRVVLAAAVVAALAVNAPASQAVDPAPKTVCELTGDFRFSPGIRTVAPSPKSSFRLDTSTFVCGGRHTFVGWISASGSVGSDLSFSGSFGAPSGCSGVVNGTLLGGAIIGTVAGNCGSGTIQGTHVGVPDPWSGLVMVASVSATITFA